MRFGNAIGRYRQPGAAPLAPVVVAPVLPQLTLSGPLTYATDAASGTLVANIGNVPAGVTPSVTPGDGRIVIAGSAGAWTVVKGLSASTAGNLAFTVNATGAQSVNGTAVVTAAAGTPSGAARSFAVSDPTILEPDANGKGVFANGWSGVLVFKDLQPNANVNMFDGQQVTINVTDPGFTTAGATTTVNRAIKGTIAMRRPYPNNTQRRVSATGADLSVTFALSDVIYAGTVINSVVVGAGVYAGAVATTIAGPIPHGSTRAYPKPAMLWLNRQFERATGTAHHVETYMSHRHGRNGQMVACVEYIAKDPAGNVAATQRASAPALSMIQTQGQITETWQADIPLAALNQTTSAADVSKIHVKAYPWIGDASAILDTEAENVAWPSQVSWQSLQFVNDKTGGYGGGLAYVKAGVTGGTVSDVATTARAAPFPTVAAAATALTAWNNTNRGHNDHSGSLIRLMDDGAGGAVIHLNNNGFTPTSGLCWTRLERDPFNTAAVGWQNTSSGANAMPDLFEIGAGVTYYGNSGTGYNIVLPGNTTTLTNRLSLDGCTIDMRTNATGKPLLAYCSSHWTRNVTVLNPTGSVSSALFFGGFGFSRTIQMLALGVIATGVTFDRNYGMLGCTLNDCGLGEGAPNATYPTYYLSPDGWTIANNKMMNCRSASRAFGAGYNWDYNRGIQIVQNVMESINIVGSPSYNLFNFAADGAVKVIADSLDAYNTVNGNRGNWLYSDVPGSAGIEKRGVSRFTLTMSKPTKGDPVAQVAGATGNWEWCYQVGCAGTVCLMGAANQSGTVNAGADPDGVKWQGMFWQPGSVPVVSTTYPNNLFVSDKCGFDGFGGTGGTGGDSDFRPNPALGTGHVAYGRVPAGAAMLRYDIAGAARKNDGTGYAGAYEG